MTLAEPLARALLTAEWGAPLEEGDLDRSLDEALDGREEWWETPRQLAAATLGWLRNDPATLAALAEALHDRYGAALCLNANEDWDASQDPPVYRWDRCVAKEQWREEAAALANALFGAP